MTLYVELPPSDTRTLPEDPRIRPRPPVLPMDEGRDPTRLAAFVASCRGGPCWVEVGRPSDLDAVVAAGAQPWLRGLEAGGRCGDTGTVVLIRAAVRCGAPWVVQGLGRRGMAAALALGAHGVQLDIQTWLLDDSPLHPAHQERLAGRTARDTQRVQGVRSLFGDAGPDWVTRPELGLPTSTALAGLPSGRTLADWLPAFAAELHARAARVDGALLRADPFGTGRPIVQGPMANVSERPDLARLVRAAGALPFCALGALRPEQAEEVLDGMASVVEPWGAGVIGFDVMPHRDAHLAALEVRGNRPVILAGASPALARDLRARGLDPWLHTPSPRLASLALRRGVRTLIFEGREAGGHVGQLPSAALWEEGIDVCLDAAEPTTVILAGGIGDATTAAFAAAMADDLHRAGHRVGLQVGTAFFFTHEIVEVGQITPTYQQAALGARETVLVGDTVGLPLRCSPNDYTRAAITRERRWRQEERPLRERREQVERHNLGRTRIAARGIERDGQGGYRRLPVRDQRADGAFTMGQGATLDTQLRSIAELIDELTEGAHALLRRRTAPVQPIPAVRATHTRRPATPPPPAKTPQERPSLAIVGLGCVLPGASDVPTFWSRTLAGMNAIVPVPEERWPAHRYFHPDPTHSPTQSYVRMAGLVGELPFDPVSFGIPPSVAPSMDRAQQLALCATAEAVRGLALGDRRRVGVYLGNSMGGEHAKSLAVRVRFREILALLGRDGDDALDASIHAALEHRLPPVDVESMSGLLANVIAGRVAAWLDLGGGNATVDAACASSLAALHLAADALRDGRCDLVITGGVDADLSPETFVGFCRTHALSPTGSQPFSARADGFVMGEGAAVFALKRLEDAQRDGDRIFATLAGIGSASDGRSTGITAPKVEGQELAIRRALADGDIDPATVFGLEAHGTGTGLGDPTEVRALSKVYPGGALTSVKSQIGHLKGAAGAAGLLRAVLSVHHGLLPPTCHAGPLHPLVGESPFQVPRRALPYPGRLRRCAVSAFGFGGTDVHAVVESEGEPLTRSGSTQVWSDLPTVRVECFGAEDRQSLARRVRTGATCTPEEAAARPLRLVRVEHTPGIERWILDGGRGAFGRRAWLGEGPPRAAVTVYPGQGSPRSGVADALLQVPHCAETLRALDASAPDEGADPAAQHHLLVATGAAYAALLSGVLPLRGVLGHSVGELSALVGAGRLTAQQAVSLADARGAALQGCEPGAMLAVRGPFRPLEGCHLAVRNSPDNWVAAGPPDAIDAAAARLTAEGVRCTLLDVQRAFHSPAVRPAAEQLAHALREIRPTDGLPWWSNVDGIPSEPSAAELTAALVRGVTETVGFEDSVRAALDAGADLFVHVGPGASLARHLERIAPEATVIALHPDRDPDGGDLVRAAAALAAEGHPGLLHRLPGTWLQIAFPREVVPRPLPTGSLTLETVPTPEPPAAPPPDEEDQPEGDPDSPREVVLRCIAETTGYPRAALLGGSSLDRDLGIDSIRKLEIVGRIQEELGIELDEAALAGMEGLDVEGLIAFVEAGPRIRTEEPRQAAGIFSMDVPFGQADPRPTLRRWLQEGIPTTGGEDDRALSAFLRVACAERGVGFDDPQLPVVGPSRLEPDELPDAPVVFASGGTSGILVPCLASLPGARGVILGRQPEADPPVGFTYLRCDVTDPVAVAAAAEQCRALYGPIDLVVHAAGRLRDGPAAQATVADLEAVFGVKLDGATSMIQATLEDAPARFVSFSSVSATLTNPGQALYAAANAALEGRVHPNAERTIPMAWTAWRERGMAADPDLQRLLAARGIQALDPDEGAALFRRALAATGPVWIAHRAPTQGQAWPLTGVRPDGWEVRLDPEDPLLVDHSLAGAPLVPAALWVQALRAAGLEHPRSVAILAPTRVRSERCARVVQRGTDWHIELDGTTVVTARQGDPLPPPPAFHGAPQGRFDYGTSALFHGPSWQTLTDVEIGPTGAIAALQTASATATLDTAYQILALWALENAGWLALPVGLGALGPLAACAVLRLTCRVEGDEVIADAHGFSEDGVCRLVALELRSRRAHA